jgi:hypothetical protein
VQLKLAISNKFFKDATLFVRHVDQCDNVALFRECRDADLQRFEHRAANAKLACAFRRLLKPTLERRLIDLPDEKMGIDTLREADAQMKKVRTADGQIGRIVDVNRVKSRPFRD